MGMSSSQARLLSLTAKLHNIELKSQRLQADKLRMANDSDQAYKTYLTALNKTKTNAIITLQDGTLGDTLLTADKVYTFATLAKQYVLKSQDGKTLIPERLHNAYKNTNSLFEFLNYFGLIENVEYTTPDIEKNPEYDAAIDRWEQDHKQWEQNHAQWKQEHAQWQEDKEYWENVEYPGWQTQEPDRNDPIYNPTTENLGDKFMQAGTACYERAKNNGDVGCYQHVLGQIIDFSVGKGYSGSGRTPNYSWYDGTNNKYTTSTGDSFILNYGDYTGGTCNNNTSCPIFAEVSEKIDNEDGYKAAKTEGETCDVTTGSTKGDKLLSKWNTDGTLKSIKQWAKDLFYLCDYDSVNRKYNYELLGLSKEQMKQSVIDFQEGLAGSVSFDQEKFDKDYQDWLNRKPQEPPEPPEPVEPILEDYLLGIPAEIVGPDNTVTEPSFKNTSEAQWYINQWYKMEGQDETQKIKEKVVVDTTSEKEITLTQIENVIKSNTTYGTNKWSGTEENENYIVMLDALLESNEWINQNLQEGFVLIQVFDTVEHKFIDTSTAVDSRLETVADDMAITKAESDYESKMNEINAKETKIDEELSTLEANRSAITTQQEDLKKIVNDNIDLSFKLFS